MTTYGPSELISIGLDPADFRKFGANEWHGPCPICKGGEDRFAIFTDRPFPHWNWWCRVCHPESGWIDEISPRLKENDPKKATEQAARRAEEAARDLERKIKEAQKTLEELRQAQAWLRYHDQLTEQAIKIWESWGIPEGMLDFWKFGYEPDRVVWTGTTEWHTPTMTIPVFEPNTWNVLNIKHRLLNPFRPGDKYRPERAGLPQSIWIADPDLGLSGRTFIVEGEKKAAVTWLALNDASFQVAGMPGKNTNDKLIEQFIDCEPIYICLDPDANQSAQDLADKLGRERARVLRLPMKIDDAILVEAIDKSGLIRLMKMAR